MTTLSEHITSRSFTLGRRQNSVELKVHLHDCPDQLAAEQRLWAETPGLWPTDQKTLVKTAVSAKPLSDTLWEGTVTYGDPDAPQNQDPPKAGDVKVGYRFSSSTHKVTRSKKTIARYGAGGQDKAPDFHGAVGVDASKGKGKVSGADVKVPTFELVITGYFLRSQLTEEYRVKVGRLADTVNEKPFFGFQQGELLFDGAHFDARSSSPLAEVEFTFAHEPNVTEPIRLVDANGGEQVVHVEKKGWDYVWIYYRPQEVDVPIPEFGENAKILIMQPAFAYVERMYDFLDWADLKLGA